MPVEQHKPGDECPVHLDLTKTTELPKQLKFRWQNSPLGRAVKETGVHGLKMPIITRQARHALREGVSLGLTQQDPVEQLRGGQIFHPGTYEPGTTLKIYNHIIFSGHPYLPLERLREMLERTTRFFSEAMRLDENTYEAHYPLLSMVVQAPDRRSNFVVAFDTDEIGIFQPFGRHTLITRPLEIGSSTHMISRGRDPFTSQIVQSDQITTYTGIDVFGGGKKVEDEEVFKQASSSDFQVRPSHG